MLHADLELVKHIYDECSFILSSSQKITLEKLTTDPTLRRAIERSHEIIGEPCKRVDPDFKLKYPEVAWKEMAGTRDVIIHNYTGVDYEIVWQIIQNEIPELEFQLKNILNDNN